MVRRADRLWDKSDRKCLVCGESYSPVRHTQKFCPPPKRCRYTNKARILSRNPNPHPLICKDCGSEFMPRASNQVTCGMSCPGKPDLIKRCANAFCNKKFTVTRQVSPNRQIFCSRECNRKEEVFRKYQLTSRKYKSLLQKQKGLCLGCDQPPTEEQRLAVDHDHSCCSGPYSCGKCIRGLMHLECNFVEGMFKDSPQRLLILAQKLSEGLI